MDSLAELRGEVVDGGFASLGTRLFGEARLRRGLLQENDWRQTLQGAVEQGEEVVRRALGADRVAR